MVKNPSPMLNGKGSFKVTSWEYQWAFPLCSGRADLIGLFHPRSLWIHFQACAVQISVLATLPTPLYGMLSQLSCCGFPLGGGALLWSWHRPPSPGMAFMRPFQPAFGGELGSEQPRVCYWLGSSFTCPFLLTTFSLAKLEDAEEFTFPRDKW